MSNTYLPNVTQNNNGTPIFPTSNSSTFPGTVDLLAEEKNQNSKLDTVNVKLTNISNELLGEEKVVCFKNYYKAKVNDASGNNYYFIGEIIEEKEIILYDYQSNIISKNYEYFNRERDTTFSSLAKINDLEVILPNSNNAQTELLNKINTKLENNLNVNLTEQSTNLKVSLSDDEYLVYRNESLNINIETISAYPSRIYGINVINLQDNFVYVKFYDTNDKIKVGEIEPKEVLAIPARGVLLIEPKTAAFSSFTNSIKIGACLELNWQGTKPLDENIFIEVKYKI